MSRSANLLIILSGNHTTTVFELLEILRTADLKAKVAFLPGGTDTEDAEEIVAVAMP